MIIIYSYPYMPLLVFERNISICARICCLKGLSLLLASRTEDSSGVTCVVYCLRVRQC